MKVVEVCPISKFYGPIEAKFIRKIEHFRDNEIHLVLRDGVLAHPIACIDKAKYSYAPKAEFRVAHSDDALVVMFEVEESHLRGLSKCSTDNIGEDSCVGISVECPMQGCNLNIEANCIGTLRAARHSSSANSTPISKEELAQIHIFGSLANVRIDSRGEGQSWWLVLTIPFSVLGLQSAPKMLRCNFYKRGDKCDRPHLLSWVAADNVGEIYMA